MFVLDRLDELLITLATEPEFAVGVALAPLRIVGSAQEPATENAVGVVLSPPADSLDLSRIL